MHQDVRAGRLLLHQGEVRQDYALSLQKVSNPYPCFPGNIIRNEFALVKYTPLLRTVYRYDPMSNHHLMCSLHNTLSLFPIITIQGASSGKNMFQNGVRDERKTQIQSSSSFGC